MTEPPPAGTPTRRRVLAVARFVLGVAVLAAVVSWLAPSIDDLRARVHLHAGHVALAFVGTFAATVTTAARWKLLTEEMGGTPLRYGVYFHYLALTRLMGMFSSTLVMDLLGRSVALRTAGSERGVGHLLTPVIVERVLDVVLPVVLVGWIVGLVATGNADAPWPSFMLVLAVFTAVAVATLRPLAAAALHVYWWIRRRREPDLAHPELEPLSGATSRKVVSLGVLRYGAIAVQFWAAGAAVGVALAPTEILGALPVAQLTATLGITPGGLGIQEVGWTGALKWLHLDATAIAVFILASRVLVIANFAVLSLISRPLARSVSP